MNKNDAIASGQVTFRASALERYRARKKLTSSIDLKSPQVELYSLIFLAMMVSALCASWYLWIPSTAYSELISYEPASLDATFVIHVSKADIFKAGETLKLSAPGLNNNKELTVELESIEIVNNDNSASTSKLEDHDERLVLKLSGRLNQPVTLIKSQTYLLQGEAKRVLDVLLDNVKGVLRNV